VGDAGRGVLAARRGYPDAEALSVTA
jgi:hypothetical protein